MLPREADCVNMNATNLQVEEGQTDDREVSVLSTGYDIGQANVDVGKSLKNYVQRELSNLHDGAVTRRQCP